ncbi:MAG: helix-turn-helix transcriptional regulator [Rhodocyclaceae bacterium]|nr:helix-turn-helix transcriptional regulator [Rhodocyclaceae bacterium]
MDESSKSVAPPDARRRRERAVSRARRELILEAAREAFAEHGLAGASLREIARRAGYTPGALYSYFDSKEAIYGALLGESLERLNTAVDAALAGATGPRDRLRRAARAFYGFYRDYPRELDLGFYLFNGVRPMGLTPALNEALNARLRDALSPAEVALTEMGLPAAHAVTETTMLFAQMVGLLVLAHTGRIRLFGQQPEAVLEDYLARFEGA